MAESELMVEIARFVERVAATARTGLAFKPDGYDSERYEELLYEAARLSAAVAGAGASDAAALRRRWREEVIAGYDGYVTPGAGCGAIAFNDRDEVLMLQRTSGKWWYPGGFCDVGLSPAENATKEAREETGLIVRPLRLMALVDSFKAGSPLRHIYTALFYCRVEGGELRPSPLEALDARFFPLDALPRPLHRDNLHWAELAREFHFAGRVEPYFDPPLSNPE
jgi:ADP-ribose pyrophosphatase YjhB (NUDIX family)